MTPLIALCHDGAEEERTVWRAVARSRRDELLVKIAEHRDVLKAMMTELEDIHFSALDGSAKDLP